MTNLNGTDGSNASAGIMLDPAGNLYTTPVSGGNTAFGNGFGDGTVIQVTPGGAVNTLATLTDLTGSHSYSGVVFDNNRNIFVACGSGGDLSLNSGHGYGDVIELVNSGTVASPAYSGSPLTLATFSGTNGSSAEGQLILDSHGNIFGTTYNGGDLTLNNGNGAGTVFELRNTGTVTTPNYSTGITSLGIFEGTNGSGAAFGLVMDSRGNLYGGTEQGGDLTQFSGNGAGSIYKIANTGTVANPTYTGGITTLCNLETTNGLSVNGSLLLDSNGNLLGVTGAGGDLTQNNGFGSGTVFELANIGTVANPTFGSVAMALYGFQTASGNAPIGNLAIDPSGNIFGGLSEGGANNDGAIFELSPGGTSAPEPGAVGLLALGLAVTLTSSRCFARNGSIS